jgi:predicted nucleotidyltransferase
METNNDIRQIISYFKNRDEVSALYLFGSIGRGRETKESDIDIAILIDESRLKRKSYDILKKEYFSASPRFTLRPVDIVILNTASPHLKHHILKTGKMLFDRNRRLRVLFTARAIVEYLDYKPIEDICLGAVANRFRRATVGR